MPRDLTNLEHLAAPQRVRWVAGGQQLDRLQWVGCQVTTISLDRPEKADAQVQVTTRQHRDQISAGCFEQSDFYTGIALAKSVQERSKCHFRSHTSSRDIEDSRVAAAAFDYASAVAQRVSALQKITTFHQKLLSFRGQYE